MAFASPAEAFRSAGRDRRRPAASFPASDDGIDPYPGVTQSGRNTGGGFPGSVPPYESIHRYLRLIVANLLLWPNRHMDEGAQLVIDGRGRSLPGHEQGFFLWPTQSDYAAPRGS